MGKKKEISYGEHGPEAAPELGENAGGRLGAKESHDHKVDAVPQGRPRRLIKRHLCRDHPPALEREKGLKREPQRRRHRHQYDHRQHQRDHLRHHHHHHQHDQQQQQHRSSKYLAKVVIVVREGAVQCEADKTGPEHAGSVKLEERFPFVTLQACTELQTEQ